MVEKKIKVKLLSEKAKVPAYAHEGDAGLDLFTPETFTLKAGEKKIVDTKVAIELPEGTVGLIWDKSGLGCLKGIKTLGGVFDHGFRGSYTIGLINLSDQDYTFEAGDKICQLLIQPVVSVEVEKVEKLDKTTSRGEGKFGSTGR